MNETDPKDGSDDLPVNSEESYELEPTSEPEVGSDVSSEPEERRCQQCGAPMPEDESILVCPSCGYDILTNQTIDPAAPPRDETPPTSDASVDEDLESEPLSTPGNSTPWLIAAGVVAGVVVMAMLAGWSSFFPRIDGRFLDAEGKPVLDAPRTGIRFAAVFRYLVGSSVLLGAGVIALWITSRIERLKLGDLGAWAARCAAIITVASLARLISIDIQWLQNVIHLLVGVLVVASGSVLVLRRRDRVVGLLLAIWALVMMLVVPVARLISWSIPF